MFWIRIFNNFHKVNFTTFHSVFALISTPCNLFNPPSNVISHYQQGLLTFLLVLLLWSKMSRLSQLSGVLLIKKLTSGMIKIKRANGSTLLINKISRRARAVTFSRFAGVQIRFSLEICSRMVFLVDSLTLGKPSDV